MTSLQVFDREIRSGERAAFLARVSERNDSSPVTVPVVVIRGKRAGPVCVVTGAVHGDEPSGWDVWANLAPTLQPATLRGTIIGIPIVHALAFQAEGQRAPVDYESHNMNRIWPGAPDGYLVQRMAHVIFQQCLRFADAVLDVHDGGVDLLARYLILGGSEESRCRVHHKTMQLARWFGHGLPIRDLVFDERMVQEGRTGALYEACGRQGIPCIMIEVGGGGAVWPDLRDIGVAGIRNILIGLGMIDGEMTGQDEPQPVLTESAWIQAGRGGLCRNAVRLGDIVEAGGTLGEILDPLGGISETLRAPYRSVMVDVRFHAAVYPGDLLYHCGRLVDA
jgi:predicted deacylase